MSLTYEDFIESMIKPNQKRVDVFLEAATIKFFHLQFGEEQYSDELMKLLEVINIKKLAKTGNLIKRLFNVYINIDRWEKSKHDDEYDFELEWKIWECGGHWFLECFPFFEKLGDHVVSRWHDGESCYEIIDYMMGFAKTLKPDK